MQRLEQEIKELQSGLGAVVQALTFLQNFLESDYGLKFQFHAYCNSPLYSHNSNILEVLKQKYGNLNGNEYGNNNTRIYQAQTHPGTGDPQLVHVRFQSAESGQGMESTVNVINGCVVGSCTAQALGQAFVTVTNPGDLSVATVHQQQTPPSSEDVSDGLNSSQRTPIIVNDDDIRIFGINMKDDSHGIYHNEGEMDTFGKQEFEENSESNDEEISSLPSSEAPDVGLKKVEETTNSPPSNTSKKARSKKDRLSDGYKCPHCRRRCADRAKLEVHMSHHKQQFQCSECGIWLADKSVLNRHMRVHSGIRPFTCEFCKETFTRQDIVKKHIQRKHKEMVENGNFMSGIKINKPAASTSNG